jgi:hypothetical protein
MFGKYAHTNTCHLLLVIDTYGCLFICKFYDFADKLTNAKQHKILLALITTRIDRMASNGLKTRRKQTCLKKIVTMNVSNFRETPQIDFKVTPPM